MKDQQKLSLNVGIRGDVDQITYEVWDESSSIFCDILVNENEQHCPKINQ
jgi:hypothetical protein